MQAGNFSSCSPLRKYLVSQKHAKLSAAVLRSLILISVVAGCRPTFCHHLNSTYVTAFAWLWLYSRSFFRLVACLARMHFTTVYNLHQVFSNSLMLLIHRM